GIGSGRHAGRGRCERDGRFGRPGAHDPPAPRGGSDEGREGRAQRGRVAKAAHSRAVQHPSQEGHREGVHRPVLEQQGEGHVRLRWLRPAALLLVDEVRFRHGLAELLCPARAGSGERRGGPGLLHRAHGGPVQPPRRPPRPRLRRWSSSDGAPLLLELGGPRLRACRDERERRPVTHGARRRRWILVAGALVLVLAALAATLLARWPSVRAWYLLRTELELIGRTETGMALYRHRASGL